MLLANIHKICACFLLVGPRPCLCTSSLVSLSCSEAPVVQFSWLISMLCQLSGGYHIVNTPFKEGVVGAPSSYNNNNKY